MKGIQAIRSTLFSVVLLCTITLHAQVDVNDPFQGNYIMGKSSEIVILTGSNGNLTATIYNANGAVETGGLVAGPEQRESDPWGVFGQNGQIDAATGDFNGDGLDDVVAAWEGPNRSVTLYIPHIDGASLSWSNATRVKVQDHGFPQLFENNDDFFLRRHIRIATGQFDDDREQEIVLAYWANDATSSSDPVQVIVFDTDSTLTPRVAASIADVRMNATLNSNGLERGSLLDVATGDFDRDGVDEIVLTAVEPGAQSGTRYGWNLNASVYRYDAETGMLARTAKSTLFGEPFNSSRYMYRLSIETGDFNGDFYEEIAIGWERTDNNLFTDIFLQVAQVSASLNSVQMIGSAERFTGSNGRNGWPVSVATGDVNLNGRDEILIASRSNMDVYKTDVNLNIQSSPLAFFSISTDEAHSFHQIAAITDLDLTESDSIRTDFVVADRNSIKVFQGTPDGEKLRFDFNPTAEVRDFGMVLVTGDFDGDAVRLGPPSRETRTDIVQPLVILNAPPIHFDVFDGQSFDINKCYNDNTCEHRAIYENAQSIEMEVATQVNADWGVSKSISATAGGGFGPISASVTGTLSRRYGEGFSNVSGSSQTYKVTVTSDAIEDDRVYATVSNYEILEYPVYADNELKGHVVAVVPIQHGVNSLRNTWFSAKSGNARGYLSAHEVGNIFSYQKTATLPPGATLFGRGGLAGGGGDSWELSPTSTQKWEIRFSSEQITERERSSFQQVSRSLSGEVSAGFSFFSASVAASVSDDYETSQISTHRTTVQKESAISVEFGTIDAGILGTKTYTVSPYVYWAQNGALVLDYAVNPDVSAGVPSWWEQHYGDKPDLAFTLPWRNDEAKGIGSTNPEVQREETREIIFNPANPLPGETVEIITRVHNFSLVDYFATSSVRFYLGDPRIGGTLITNQSGQSVVEVPALRTRESQVVSLKEWLVPQGITKDSKIYAVIDEENAVEEVHENNNIAWNLINPFISPTTGVEDNSDRIPTAFDLLQNYPNPFNPSTVIRFQLPVNSSVKLTVYNLLGEVVIELLDEEMRAGSHEMVFDASRFASGIYFYRLQAGGKFVAVKKMLLTK